MKIEFSRSGGFAGLRLKATVDTETLDAERAAEIAGLVAASGFFELPERARDNEQIRDGFEYHVRISTAAHPSHSVAVGQQDVPEQLQPLLDLLTAIARRSPDENTRWDTGA
jgi:hypothetical protein